MYLREQRRIEAMFDHAQPKDDDVFGLIGCDDYFGES